GGGVGVDVADGDGVAVGRAEDERRILVDGLYGRDAVQRRLSFPTRRSSDLAGRGLSAAGAGIAEIVGGDGQAGGAVIVGGRGEGEAVEGGVDGGERAGDGDRGGAVAADGEAGGAGQGEHAVGGRERGLLACA